MPNIEQQQKTKTNYDTKILNNMNKHKPTIIPNFEQEEQTKINYDTKYRTAATNKIQL